MSFAGSKQAEDKVRLCTLRVGKEMFGIESAEVREVLGKATPQAVPRAPGFVAGVLAYRGEVLLAVSLPALLGETDGVNAGSAVVMRDTESGEMFALLVNAVADVVEVEAERWEANPATLDERRKELFSGVYRLEQSHVVRLEPERLQPSRLARVFEKERGVRVCGY